MSLTIHSKYKYFNSTVQRTRDGRQKFHFCRLPFSVNVMLNLSTVSVLLPLIGGPFDDFWRELSNQLSVRKVVFPAHIRCKKPNTKVERLATNLTALAMITKWNHEFINVYDRRPYYSVLCHYNLQWCFCMDLFVAVCRATDDET